MSFLPRQYHGPEVKCGGPPFCRDCSERQYRLNWMEAFQMFTPSETTISCICVACGYKWSESITAFAVKNSLYERSSCVSCKPVSGAV